ncbi:diguanylate cyclase [Aestuariirhabdus litorea]|uniref:diguanylate cyclase n=1 Tax=Aestuariirhabdus litorea TaxID=2528527 RepID=A0A3P3VJJ4_9GAMM|nr:diguanylate cyclase [Aestuariirhabdus litorea]RRJ82862.1 diguanylate cyclase [Aestuariirhabdus litorea]RWW93021.1 diguanylate cyclase [Endozoicomonadaceae bacterium GTF-13]
MIFRKIGHRIIVVVGAVVIAGLVAMALFYAEKQRESIIAQNEEAANKMTGSLIRVLETVMLAGYADIAQAFANSLRSIPEVHEFRIMRTNGLEAFRDNTTISAVNLYRGEEDFFPRDEEIEVPIYAADNPRLREVLQKGEMVRYYDVAASGERFLTYLVPIENKNQCHKCHGDSQQYRGVIKLTSTLARVDADITKAWQQSMAVLAIVVTFILLVTWWLVRRSIVQPIHRVTEAMEAVSRGDMSQKVPVLGKDELGSMAKSFNRMSSELQSTYLGLHHEQNKLTTIILSAQEGIVVTNALGEVVLVNPAAEYLLQKSHAQIVEEGFMQVFDNEALMASWLKLSEQTLEPIIYEYKGRLLSTSIATIRNPEGQVVGSSAMLRDITNQKKLEEELRALSNTDGLTKLFNRRFLDETLKAELERSYRYGTELGILMFDVDHFKKFNDEHGHDQGDRVLQVIAREMRRVSRSLDFPCRYGGEEFLIILPNTSMEGAMVLAERLRADIAATVVDGLQVTISIGVSSARDHKPVDAAAFIALADGALYEAKREGRNCVRSATAQAAH